MSLGISSVVFLRLTEGVLVDRAYYFQESVREKGGEPLAVEPVQELINTWVSSL